MGKSTDSNQYMYYLIFTYFPECYQMVAMPSPAVGTLIHTRTGQPARSHGQQNKRFRARPVIRTMTKANPNNYSHKCNLHSCNYVYLRIKCKKKKTTKSIFFHLFTFSFFHCTIKGKTNSRETYSTKRPGVQALAHYVISCTSKSLCLQSHKSKICINVWIERKVTACT